MASVEVRHVYCVLTEGKKIFTMYGCVVEIEVIFRIMELLKGFRDDLNICK